MTNTPKKSPLFPPANKKVYREEKRVNGTQPPETGSPESEFDWHFLDEINREGETFFSVERKPVCLCAIETDLGTMIAGATEKGICLFEFADRKNLKAELRQLVAWFNAPLRERDSIHFNALRHQIKKYFKGQLREFKIPLDLAGTDFQIHAWLGLRRIPYGSTTTYAGQAQALGKPSAIRAVAHANGKNRISIVLPCHRVIGSNGSLTGYGGGLWRKKFLLELEQTALKEKEITKEVSPFIQRKKTSLRNNVNASSGE